MTTPFLKQRYSAQSAGLAIVRKIIKSDALPDGFTTKQLYKLAVEEPAPPDFTPFPLVTPVPRKALLPKPSRKRPAAVKPQEIAAYPEHPEHPIRSIRFLKEYILPFLQGAKEITMTRRLKAKSQAAIDAAPTNKKRMSESSVEWVWKVIPLGEQTVPPAPPKVKEVVGTEVGVGADVSHLNKRRQAARVGKVSREVVNLKSYKRFTDVRDPLIERLESNSEILEKVSSALDKSKRTGLDAVLEAEKKANRHIPKRAPFPKPIAGPLLRKQLDEARQHAAYGKQPRDATA